MMMRTENDLRTALQSLERHAPEPGTMLRIVYGRSPGTDRGRPIPRRGHQPRMRRMPLGLAAGAAAALAAAAVLSGTLTGGTANGGHPAQPQSLQARLLAAIASTRGDILHAGNMWMSPWYPRPGQRVRVHQLATGAGGMPFKDSEFIFRFPASRATGHDASPIDWGGVSASGTELTVDYAKRTWGEWAHMGISLTLPLSAAGIRDQITHGSLQVIGRTTISGRPAIELGMALGPKSGPLWVTTARLWVSATTYLPMRELLVFSDGRRELTNYTFLKPTAANLAKVRLVVPAGFRRTSLHPDQYGKKYQK
jgi:hypothetical protein